MRYIIVSILASLSMLAAPAEAQVSRNCVTQTCTLTTDPMVGTPTSPPTLCRLYSGATRLAEAAVAVPYVCTFTRNFAAGPWSVTARYATSSEEGPDSNVLAFTSALPIPLPAPTNLRFQ